jgi:uncharacterized membrane protein YphA (DoxX/SURF4 family)
MSTPISDLFDFLTANTGDFNSLGYWKYLLLFIFYVLIAASLAFAVVNWREDPRQRNGRTLWLFVTRFLIGCMWFQGTLWKLPFGEKNGLYYWTQQMAGRAAFEFHREFVQQVLLPHFAILNPIVYLAELGFAVALILGLCVRLASLGAMAFTLNLWLGIYNKRPGDPDEWPWSYIFLVMVLGYFLVDAAGRALGADAWLRRNVASVRDGRGLGAVLRLFT